LKIAKAVPIFKSEDKLAVNNYHPVSVLPASSKIQERLIYNRLYNYFEPNHMLTNKQFGFKAHHSTSMAKLH